MREPAKAVDLSTLDAVAIARLLETEGGWSGILAEKKDWKRTHSERRYGPDICTTAVVNPSGCKASEIDWAQLRPMLAEGSDESYFGFCPACATVIEAAGLKFMPGSLKEAVQAAMRARRPEYDAPGRVVASAPAPSPPATPAAPQPKLPAPVQADPIEAMDLPEVQDQLAALEKLRRAMGDTQYAQVKAKLLVRKRALDDAVLAKQRREEDEALARLEKVPGEARVKPAAPASKPTPPAAPVLQLVPREEPPRPASKPKLITCSACKEIKGNPDERLELIPVFDPQLFDIVDKCFDALAETGPRYRELVLMHAAEDASEADLRDSGSEAWKCAKNASKNCPLHGKETKALGWFRYQVIEHITAKWPEAWKQRKDEVGSNGEDAPKLQCGECGKQVRKLFGDPPSRCGGCVDREKNRETRERRESRATARAHVESARRTATKGPTGGGGGHGKKGGGKGRR